MGAEKKSKSDGKEEKKGGDKKKPEKDLEPVLKYFEQKEKMKQRHRYKGIIRMIGSFEITLGTVIIALGVYETSKVAPLEFRGKDLYTGLWGGLVFMVCGMMGTLTNRYPSVLAYLMSMGFCVVIGATGVAIVILSAEYSELYTSFIVVIQERINAQFGVISESALADLHANIDVLREKANLYIAIATLSAVALVLIIAHFAYSCLGLCPCCDRTKYNEPSQHLSEYVTEMQYDDDYDGSNIIYSGQQSPTGRPIYSQVVVSQQSPHGAHPQYASAVIAQQAPHEAYPQEYTPYSPAVVTQQALEAYPQEYAPYPSDAPQNQQTAYPQAYSHSVSPPPHYHPAEIEVASINEQPATAHQATTPHTAHVSFRVEHNTRPASTKQRKVVFKTDKKSKRSKSSQLIFVPTQG